MTNDGLNTMVYDGENHVASSTQASVTTNYTYDGNGLRLQKATGSNSTIYLFSGAKVVAEYDNGAAVTAPTREYIYAGGQLLSTIDSTGTKYHLSGHLSPHITTDASGNVIGTQAHYPFGEKWYETGTVTKYKFTSYERDPETGNDYAIMRYHINRLGRFGSVDRHAGSIFNPQSLNRYAYVLNNPVNLVDPLGLDDCAKKGSDDGSGDDGSGDCSGGGDGGGGSSDPGAGGSGDPGAGDDGQGGPNPDDPLAGLPLDTAPLDNPFTSPLPSMYDSINVTADVLPDEPTLASDPISTVFDSNPKAVIRAIQLVRKKDCLDFLAKIALGSFQGIDPTKLDPASRKFYDSIGENVTAAATLSGFASADPRPSTQVNTSGGTVVAQTKYGTNSVTLFQPFFNLDTTGQAQVLVHEGMHLYQPMINDINAAAAAGKPSNDPNVASRNFQQELQKHCH